MHDTFPRRRPFGIRRDPRNLIWMVPLGLVVGTALFFGIGTLVAWLWRETLVDVFGIKPISFWQAWGLILLSQILFKANMRPTARTGRRWRRDHDCPGPEASVTEPPLQDPQA